METDENMEPKLEEMKTKFESRDQRRISHIELITPKVNPSDDIRTFAIIEYTESIDEISNRSKLDDDVFIMVEEKQRPKETWGHFSITLAGSWFILFRQGEWVLKEKSSLSSLFKRMVR